jgi:hypothetical protein
MRVRMLHKFLQNILVRDPAPNVEPGIRVELVGL